MLHSLSLSSSELQQVHGQIVTEGNMLMVLASVTQMSDIQDPGENHSC